MPGRTEWLNDDHTIMLHLYEGKVILEDYYKVIDESYALTKAEDHVVHIIMDRSGLTESPASMTSVMRYGNKKIASNTGMRVIVGATFMTRVIVDVGRVIAKSLVDNVHFAESRDEALEIINAKINETSVDV